MSPNSPNNTTTTVLGPDEDLAGTLAAHRRPDDGS